MRNENTNNIDRAFLESRLEAICDGFREVQRRQREGLPIHVSDYGKVVDLQQAKTA